MTTVTGMRARSSRKRAQLVLLGVAITAVLAGGGVLAYLVGGEIANANSPAAPFPVTGSVTLNGSGSFVVASDNMGAACEGTGGYSDIRAGTQVAVRDPDGKVIAVGKLEQAYSMMGTCTGNFTLSVPDGFDFYGITVGDRNELQYSRKQLNAPLDLRLG